MPKDSYPKNSFATIILAAGKSTRMQSATPKVLHKLAGLPLIQHVLRTLNDLRPEKSCVIVGKDMDEVAEAAHPLPHFIQHPAQGTGHAVLQAKPYLETYKHPILILYGDTPLVTAETLQKMLRSFEDSRNAATVLGFYPDNPAQYGRLVTNAHGQLEQIVEFREATDAQKLIGFCNAGLMAVRGDVLWPLLAILQNNNAKGEYYLTDIVRHARERGMSVKTIEAEADEVIGVNSREELAYAEEIFQQKMRGKMLERGVTMIDPLSVYFSYDTEVAADVVIEPHIFFGPNVVVEQGAHIKSFCHIEGATIRKEAVIGPFARLRKGADIGIEAHIGNFVEIKNAIIEPGAKANHLSYIGDAFVGAKSNIGAGTITCNYDGFSKHRTHIGAGAFIGSNSALVAPVSIGEGAMIGAGSVITNNVEPNALGLSRADQEVKPGWAKRFKKSRENKKKAKA